MEFFIKRIVEAIIDEDWRAFKQIRANKIKWDLAIIANYHIKLSGKFPEPLI